MLSCVEHEKSLITLDPGVPGAVTVARLVYYPMEIWKYRLEAFLSFYIFYPLYFYLSYFPTFSFIFNHRQRHTVQTWMKSLNEQRQK